MEEMHQCMACIQYSQLDDTSQCDVKQHNPNQY